MILLAGLGNTTKKIGSVILQKVMEDEVWPFNQQKLHRQLLCNSSNLSYYYILKTYIILDVICNIAVV
jgi:hypothetical protein